MHYIIIPPPVQPLTLSGEPWKEERDGVTRDMPQASLSDFLLGRPPVYRGRLEDPKFAGLKGIMAVCAIQQALIDLKKELGADGLTGAILEIEDDHWSMLKAATEEPSQETRYQPGFMHSFKPFMAAIVEARDKRPSTVETRDNGATTTPAAAS